MKRILIAALIAAAAATPAAADDAPGFARASGYFIRAYGVCHSEMFLNAAIAVARPIKNQMIQLKTWVTSGARDFNGEVRRYGVPVACARNARVVEENQ
jgi:hypothetical protein